MVRSGIILFCSLIRYIQQILSRAKPATNSETAPSKEKKKKKTPKLEEFLQARDYTGAITLLEVQR